MLPLTRIENIEIVLVSCDMTGYFVCGRDDPAPGRRPAPLLPPASPRCLAPRSNRCCSLRHLIRCLCRSTRRRRRRRRRRPARSKVNRSNHVHGVLDDFERSGRSGGGGGANGSGGAWGGGGAAKAVAAGKIPTSGNHSKKRAVYMQHAPSAPRTSGCDLCTTRWDQQADPQPAPKA